MIRLPMHALPAISLALGLLAAPCVAQDIPARPEQLDFAPLTFEPPGADTFRHELTNGVPVYLAPNRELPLVNVVFTFRGGDDLDPAGQVGLVRATGALVRQGGTATIPAEDLDERFDFLAAQVTVGVGPTATTARLNGLASNLDESFALFIDMLRNPGFQANRFEIHVDEQIEAMAQRNDDADDILRREWDALLYGRDHFEARVATRPMLQSITGADLRRTHEMVIHPGNLIVAVTGDFEPRAMLRRLERALADWPAGPRTGDPPAPEHALVPGVYHVEKDIPQGKVIVGGRTIPRDHPDYFALLLANDILGGGGFTSRITDRVRNDEGLAYAAGSRFAPRVHYPGEFRASFQSRNRTVALALRIIMEEIERLRTEPVSAEELATARSSFIETFPAMFDTRADMLDIFVNDEMTGRDRAYWQHYRDRVAAVTAEEIRRAAERWLDPATMAILIVGPWAEIAPGDLEGRASMAEIRGGAVTHLPLREPFTLEPLPASTP